MTARITPAVPSGRSVTERPPRSAKVYISLLTRRRWTRRRRARTGRCPRTPAARVAVAGPRAPPRASVSRTCSNPAEARRDVVRDALRRGERGGAHVVGHGGHSRPAAPGLAAIVGRSCRNGLAAAPDRSWSSARAPAARRRRRPRAADLSRSRPPSARWSPPGRSVRPIEPANSMSPATDHLDALLGRGVVKITEPCGVAGGVVDRRSSPASSSVAPSSSGAHVVAARAASRRRRTAAVRLRRETAQRVGRACTRSAGWIRPGCRARRRPAPTRTMWSRCPWVSSTATGVQPVLGEHGVERARRRPGRGRRRRTPRPRPGADDVAVGLERPGRETGDEHATSLGATVRQSSPGGRLLASGAAGYSLAAGRQALALTDRGLPRRRLTRATRRMAVADEPASGARRPSESSSASWSGGRRRPSGAADVGHRGRVVAVVVVVVGGHPVRHARRRRHRLDGRRGTTPPRDATHGGAAGPGAIPTRSRRCRTPTPSRPR